MSTPDEFVTEIFTEVRDAILNSPRSLQVKIGPSEIGNPCARRIAYKITGQPEVNTRGVAWKPFVGTAIHEQMATIMAAAEIKRFQDDPDATPRWRVEERVTVGQINGVDITGNADLYDQHRGVVYDWKFVGNRALEKYRANGPGEQYRTQAHLYGRGFASQGLPVHHVAVVFMTRDGEFKDRVLWHEPYDEQVAIDALERASTIAGAMELLGAADALALIPATESWCGNCPYFKAGSSDLTVACPGVDNTGADITDSVADVFLR